MIASKSRIQHLFWYGYNHPSQVAKLLNISVEKLLPRWKPCTLNGYRRAFAQTNNAFEFSSAATIVEDSNSSIDTYAFQIEENKLTHIDQFEEYPREYNRIKIQLESKDIKDFEAQAYVMTKKNTFEYPSYEYLHGVALTMATHNYLSLKHADYENISINIYDKINQRSKGYHTIKLSLEDYPECVRDKVLKLHVDEQPIFQL